jgi:hypothetical protein
MTDVNAAVSHDEIRAFLDKKRVEDSLSVEEKERLLLAIEDSLPLVLNLISCYADEGTVAVIDFDDWNRLRAEYKRSAEEVLPDEPVYLFIRTAGFLGLVSKRQLLDTLFDPEFFYEFGVFSLDLTSYLVEDHSGPIIGNGRFANFLKPERN